MTKVKERCTLNKRAGAFYKTQTHKHAYTHKENFSIWTIIAVGKNSVEGLNSKLDTKDERISEYRSEEITLNVVPQK